MRSSLVLRLPQLHRGPPYLLGLALTSVRGEMTRPPIDRDSVDLDSGPAERLPRRAELLLRAVRTVGRNLVVDGQIGAPPLLAVAVRAATLDATETAATLEAVLPAGLLELLEVPVETRPDALILARHRVGASVAQTPATSLGAACSRSR
jgi:hypothetical protein